MIVKSIHSSFCSEANKYLSYVFGLTKEIQGNIYELDII